MKQTKRRVGAPTGGRVHWLLMFLHRDFKRAYELRFDYEYHNYHFTRYEKKTPIDEYIIIRTSRDCFRVVYFNFQTTYFQYFSETTAQKCAEHIEEMYEKVKKSEEGKD